MELRALQCGLGWQLMVPGLLVLEPVLQSQLLQVLVQMQVLG